MFGSLEDNIWTNTDILTLHCDLDLECSNSIFSQDTLAYDDVSSDQVWLPRNQQFRRYSRKSQFDHMSLSCDLSLEDSKQSFPHMTLWLMMLHYYTKFGNKMFCSSEDIIQKNIH